MSKHRYKLLVGPYAGQEFEGEPCNARLYPTATPNGTLGDGIWIPAIQTRFPKYVGNDPNPDYQDLVVPFDKNGDEILVGVEILFPQKTGGVFGGACFNVGKVLKIGEPIQRGYGYMTRNLTVEPAGGGRKVTVNLPENCLIVQKSPGGTYILKL